ncbi:hypothetical protein LCGC14_2689710 [marine sediment metagenome]|uniref:Uncharacterized protein n=1 Tax=marine sediment metagenome TaxID=412755 RepID=A0A0F9CAK3_9ZZZZ
MRVCDICIEPLPRDSNWWSVGIAANNPDDHGKYFELCANHKNQVHEFIKLKIEEAKK